MQKPIQIFGRYALINILIYVPLFIVSSCFRSPFRGALADVSSLVRLLALAILLTLDSKAWVSIRHHKKTT